MNDVEALACQELVELVTDYLEGALDEPTRAAFDRHIAGCPNCTRYLEQLRTIVHATGQITVDDLTPEAENALLQAFRGWARTS